MDVLIRQAHPGPGVRPYRAFEQKLADARRYQEEEIPWPVLVDDLEGRVHQVYSGLADPTYLIDADGRVAFYSMWTHAPALHVAIEQLLARGGRGVVNGGIDRAVHILPAITDGWRGLRRGLPQSFVELELAMPGAASGPLLGSFVRPLIAPVTLRAVPLSLPVGLALAGAAGAAVTLLVRSLRRR